ncbi:hypothetical protein JKP88DRAFT_290807 [Tribonema minus]|uniref:Uncharacterized protein n=1 Tax=Tribonema minus TaxID=303371 RepID=A0A836CDE1_9STRA|nr:hypothetical protein JKP88DRAFT_290807 [Tribonema minus]
MAGCGGSQSPRRLSTLLQLLQFKGMAPCDPADRKGLNPFFIPMATDVDGTKVGLLRWPTPEHLAMPLVRSNSGSSPSSGLQLLATDVDHYIKRIAAEEDFKGSPMAREVIALANNGLWDSQEPYVAGSVKKLGYGVESPAA